MHKTDSFKYICRSIHKESNIPVAICSIGTTTLFSTTRKNTILFSYIPWGSLFSDQTEQLFSGQTGQLFSTWSSTGFVTIGFNTNVKTPIVINSALLLKLKTDALKLPF